MGSEGAEGVEGFEGFEGSIGSEGVEGAEEGEGLLYIYIYCLMVRTPWEQAIWLNGASKQTVGWMGDGWMDTP